MVNSSSLATRQLHKGVGRIWGVKNHNIVQTSNDTEEILGLKKFSTWTGSMSPHHPPPRVLLCREEISTLSRHASFRRMNSVSTDPRGAVLLLNYSLRIKHTAASLSYIFLPRLPNSFPACQVLWHHWSKSEHCWSQMYPIYSGILEIHWRFWFFWGDCTMFLHL